MKRSQKLVGFKDFLLAKSGSTHAFETPQELLDQLRPVSVFSNRLSQRVFIYVCLISGALGSAVYGVLLLRYLAGADLALRFLLPLPFSLFLFFVGVGVYRRDEVPGWTVWMVVGVLLSGFMLGSYVNHIAPSTFVVLFVMLFHLIQRPNQALVTSVILLLEVVVAVIWFYPPQYTPMGVRALLNGVIATVLMRLLMVTFLKLSSSASASIRLLDEQSRALKDNLLKAEITDQRVNVLNQLGLERAIAEIQTRVQDRSAPKSDLETQGRLCVMRVNHLYIEPRQLTPIEEDVFYSALVNRLRQFFGPESLIARVGQYDFALLHIAEMVANADTVQREMSAPIEINRRKITPDLRIGVLPLLGNWTLSPVDLVRNASLAMREATKSAANPVVFYDASMTEAARFRESVTAALPLAIDQREFRVVYQPIITLATGRVQKVEALLRWHLPGHGDIEPSIFIPAAENQGLIGPLTDQVFDRVCQDRQHWTTLGLLAPEVSVNVSATSLKTPEALLAMLDRFSGRERLKGITIEVTESALIDSPSDAKTCFATLRALGFGVSLDDFGVGYSSLAYLTSFSLDFLKMDKTFLQGFERDGAKQSVVRAIIDVAHSLGMEVVAEGIETQDQLDLLKTLGCDYGQGYFFSKPLAADVLASCLEPVTQEKTA